MASAIWRKSPRLVFDEREKEDNLEKSTTTDTVVLKKKQPVETGWIKIDGAQSFKTVFLGDPNVGKTCLAKMLVDREVLEQSSNTIGFDYHVKEVELELGMRVKIQVWDTAGMEQFRNALITKYYRNADGIILVYDITRRQTFENVNLWLDEVRVYVGLDKVRVALIGNKLDQASLRQVTKAEGQALAHRHKMAFYEISAKDVKQLPRLEEIFLNLTRGMFEERMEHECSLSRSGIIRLGQTTTVDSEDWIMVDAPNDPIPRSTYAAQEMKARLQTLVPKRFRNETGRRRTSNQPPPLSQRQGNSCSCL